MTRLLTIFATVFVALLLATAPASAAQTENHGQHAVPAPGKVAIDGDLSDWDLSGQALMRYNVEKLKDIYLANVALMYDTDNLYVGIHWADTNPMCNSHDPHYAADKGWSGDSVQMRIRTDWICHVTAWYYLSKQEPYIGIDYGTNERQPFGAGSVALYQVKGPLLDQGAQMAFKKDAAGHQLIADAWLDTVSAHFC